MWGIQLWGTTEHFAPEMYKRAYGPQADVWALGCVLYQLLTGDLAFPTKEQQPSLADRVLLGGGRRLKRAYELRPGWTALSAEAQSLLRGMLKRDPRVRLSTEQCLQHPWFAATTAATASRSSSSDVFTRELTSALSTNGKRAAVRLRRFEQTRTKHQLQEQRLLFMSSSREEESSGSGLGSGSGSTIAAPDSCSASNNTLQLQDSAS